MNKIRISNDINVNSLHNLLISNLENGYDYNIISKDNFTKLANKILTINIVDKRENGIGYVWYNYWNMIYIITDDIPNDIIYFFSEKDIKKISRYKKIKKLI